jgi:hypothetical protein
MQLITCKNAILFVTHVSEHKNTLYTLCQSLSTAFGELRLSLQNSRFNVPLWHGRLMTTEAWPTLLSAGKNKNVNWFDPEKSSHVSHTTT